MPKGKKMIVGEDIICPKHNGIVEKFDTVDQKFSTVISKLDGLKDQITNQFQYMDEKTTTAKTEMERRLEGMNEFRAQLNRQATEFITRQELQLMFDKQGTRIDGLADRLGVTRETEASVSGGRVWSEKVTMVLLTLGSSMFTGVMFLIARAVFKF